MRTLLGGGSPLNKFKETEKHLNRSLRTVFVDLQGDDVRGDGTIERPFSTVERALKEGVGTARTLKVMLNDGDHESSLISVTDSVVVFDGTGRLKMTAAQELLFYLNGAKLYIDVDVIDVSPVSYAAAVYMTSGCNLLVRGCTLALTQAKNFITNHSGQNNFYAGRCTITSTSSIPKVKGGSANSEPVAINGVAATYTNLS